MEDVFLKPDRRVTLLKVRDKKVIEISFHIDYDLQMAVVKLFTNGSEIHIVDCSLEEARKTYQKLIMDESYWLSKIEEVVDEKWKLIDCKEIFFKQTQM